MDAAEDGPRRLTTAMRVVLMVFLALAGLAFILLYLRSGHTAREFAWTIKPEITAAFLGAGYGAGCVLVAASLRRRPWTEVRVGIGIVLLFSTMILVAMLLHLERFHFGAANGAIARLAAWVFLAPWVFAPAWPWPLTSLTAQTVGSWLVPIGLGNLAVLREGDLQRARVPALTSVVYGLLQFGALARFGDQVQWHEAGAWIWVALLLNAIFTGGYQLLATAGGTAQGQPAIIR